MDLIGEDNKNHQNHPLCFTSPGSIRREVNSPKLKLHCSLTLAQLLVQNNSIETPLSHQNTGELFKFTDNCRNSLRKARRQSSSLTSSERFKPKLPTCVSAGVGWKYGPLIPKPFQWTLYPTSKRYSPTYPPYVSSCPATTIIWEINTSVNRPAGNCGVKKKFYHVLTNLSLFGCLLVYGIPITWYDIYDS